MVGLAKCNDCKKWKVHKAFVRSRVRRDTDLWVQNGYMWHKYKTCNRCCRTYRNKGMSVDEFIKVFGAEEHDLSEPEILIDEVEAQDIQDKPTQYDGTKDEGVENKSVENEGVEDECAEDENPETEEDEPMTTEEKLKALARMAEDAAAKSFRLERLMEWLVNQPERGNPIKAI